MEDPTTTPASNGHDPSGGTATTTRRSAPASPTPSPRPTDSRGRDLPDKTKVDIDLNRRVMVEEYIAWYYPGGKPTLDDVVNEMLSTAWRVAKADDKRPETPEERSERLGGGKR